MDPNFMDALADLILNLANLIECVFVLFSVCVCVFYQNK